MYLTKRRTARKKQLVLLKPWAGNCLLDLTAFFSLKTETACFYETLVLTRADGVTFYNGGKLVTVLENAIKRDRHRHWKQRTINSVKPSGYYMYRQFNIQQFYVLPTQCIYVFCVDLRTNSDYFPIQH